MPKNFISPRIKKLDGLVFIEYLNAIKIIYKSFKGCNPGKKRKVLMVFHDMIADTIRNKKTSSNIH